MYNLLEIELRCEHFAVHKIETTLIYIAHLTVYKLYSIQWTCSTPCIALHTGLHTVHCAFQSSVHCALHYAVCIVQCVLCTALRGSAMSIPPPPLPLAQTYPSTISIQWMIVSSANTVCTMISYLYQAYFSHVKKLNVV